MKRFSKYIICIIAISTLASCEKFLDEKPISSSTDLTFWKNEKDADQGVAAGYALLRRTLNKVSGLGFYVYGDLPTDEFTASNEQRTGDVLNMNLSITIPFSNTGDWMMQMRRYDGFYGAIDQANRCIKIIPTISDAEFTSTAAKNNLIGEAYFLRAFNYFYMTRIWGDVPLVTETTLITEAVDIPRTKEADVIAQCIKDVNAAIGLLNWNYDDPNNRAVRANKGAAYALLAHIYAWKGDYTNCNAAADQVINQNFYQYVDRATYLNIFKGKSTEGIFEIAQSAENEGSVGGISSWTLKTPYLTTATGNARFTINATTLENLYNKNANDKRFTNAFALTATTDPICIKYSNITHVNANNIITGVAHNNIIIFRLADIKLLKAEALAALTQYTAARVVLNEVRSRAGLTEWTGTDANLFEGISDERGRELFLEGHRFYDLVRLGKKTGIMKFGDNKISKGDFDAGKYYWPLDPALLQINKRLTQTTFWSSKM